MMPSNEPGHKALMLQRLGNQQSSAQLGAQSLLQLAADETHFRNGFLPKNPRRGRTAPGQEGAGADIHFTVGDFSGGER